ncbi:DUF445 family protein [Brevibacterium paucivorans]|uniref:DUF445 family protein n=1 Tax=Brevibacterium paucivorans TaxID=170994 RepID=UPI003D2A11BB
MSIQQNTPLTEKDRRIALQRIRTLATGLLVATALIWLASAISDTIASWDARKAAEKIELYVGKHLQYIRINGTVIGCLAGLLVHTVAVLIRG